MPRLCRYTGPQCYAWRGREKFTASKAKEQLEQLHLGRVVIPGYLQGKYHSKECEVTISSLQQPGCKKLVEPQTFEWMECVIKWLWLGVEERIISRLKLIENFPEMKIWDHQKMKGGYYWVFDIFSGNSSRVFCLSFHRLTHHVKVSPWENPCHRSLILDIPGWPFLFVANE